MADFTPKDSNTIKIGDAPADKKVPKKKGENKSASIEEDKTAETNSGVTFKAETASKPISQNVKVRFAKDYKGCIGGQRYFFSKNEVAIVPENVKRILSKTEGLLKPL